MYCSPALPMETALKGGEGKVLNAGDRGGGGGWSKIPRKGEGRV